MSLVFDVSIRYIWVVGLAAALVFLLRGHRALRRSEQAAPPALAVLVNSIAACMAAPWFVVGAVQFFARTPTSVAYLRPQYGEGFVLAFYGVVMASVRRRTWNARTVRAHGRQIFLQLVSPFFGKVCSGW